MNGGAVCAVPPGHRRGGWGLICRRDCSCPIYQTLPVLPYVCDPPRSPFGLDLTLVGVVAALRRFSRIFARS